MSAELYERITEEKIGWSPDEHLRGHQKEPRFSYYSNSGDIYTLPDPVSAYRLVELAKACGDIEPNARYLLSLCTERAPLENGDQYVNWDRYGSSTTVTLRDWLTENGYDLSAFSS